MIKKSRQSSATKQTVSTLLTLIFAIAALPACAANAKTESTRSPFAELEWFETPFGPKASKVDGDFGKGGHVTYVKFLPGMVTPVHSHSSDYTGIVIQGTTMHWQPGKSDTQIKLAEGSHWSIPGNVPHVSECLPGSECIMAIVQQAAFDFVPKTNQPLNDSSIVAIYQQVNGFDVAMGNLASQKAKNESVKRLGETVRDDHSGVIDATQALANQQGIRSVLPVERAAAEQEHLKQLAILRDKEGDQMSKTRS